MSDHCYATELSSSQKMNVQSRTYVGCWFEPTVHVSAGFDECASKKGSILPRPLTPLHQRRRKPNSSKADMFKPYILVTALGLAFASSALAVAPLISDLPDQVIAQSADTGTLFITIGDAETAFAALTLAASSSNTTLVPNSGANLIVGGTNARRTIKVVPVSGLIGSAVITLTVTDGEGLTASSTFSVTVTTANTAPTITGLQGFQIVSPGQTPAKVHFTVGDAQTAVAALNVVATSSNTDLVPTTNLALVNNGASRSVEVTPVVGQRGSAVIKLRVTDALGAFSQKEFIFSVFDPGSANNGFKQPRGIYVLDSVAGTTIGGVPMRDANVSNKAFVDGYVLRTEWATLEPTMGVYDFTIIDNILSKLTPINQKLSLMLASGMLPTWLNTVPGVATYTAGNPAATLPIPWNATVQERYRLLLMALSNHVVDGVPLRDHPRLAAFDPWIPGLKSGIRAQTAQIRDIPGYNRSLFEGGVLKHLANVTDNFPNVPVMIGFWTYTDATASPSAWEALRQAILAQQNGVDRPRVGFWMENLAANRAAADADPWVGLPSLAFTAPLYASQDQTFIGYQVLGSWSQPFNSDHVDNNLNGSPEDAMEYGFTEFQCRYYEHYQADIDFANYEPEWQRWHDFLAALPGSPLPLVFSSNQGGVTMNAASGAAINISLSATGGTAPYVWTLVGGALPSGITLSSGGVLSGTSTASGVYNLAVQATDSTGGSDAQAYTLTVDAPPSAPDWTATATSNADGSITLNWPSKVDYWYQVEISSDLMNWVFVGNSVRATANSMTWTDNGIQTGSHPSTQPKRFYRVRDWGNFTVNFTTTATPTFTYVDDALTVTGIFAKPAGAGPFPALIINHGTGGNAAGFSRARANEMSPWGLVCIGADLTHRAGQNENLETWGYSAENLARNRACLAALSTRSDVDLNRVVMWGHSRGAFASIGVASAFGSDLKVLGFTAGGAVENTGIYEATGQPELTYPTLDESAGIRAATLMFHIVGTPGDTVVIPAGSARLQTQLNSLGVTNNRITYDSTVTGLTGEACHNIYTTTFYPDVLGKWRAWLQGQGVLP